MRAAIHACLTIPLCLLVFSVSGVRAQDDSSAEPWLLDFKPVKLRMITPRNGPGRGRTYWYLVYTLENKTGADREYFLSVSAKSDRKKKYSDLYLPSVERAIELQERRELWGKADKFKVLKDKKTDAEKYPYTVIPDGEKRYCVAIFNRFDPNAKKITIHVAGLTNDLEIIPNEAGDEMTIRERIREITVERPGDEYEITNDTFRRLRMRWIITSTKVAYPSGL